jgi:pilus assembly protein FimV
MEKNKRELAMWFNKLSKILVPGLLAPGLVHALGMGDIAIQSYLNEPLQAVIPLRADSVTDVEDLRLRMASPTYFDRFGIVRSTLHDGIRFAVEKRGRDWVIRVSSREAIREPYLSFPLEALWRDGELIREYTVFIDPRPQARASTAGRSPSPAAQPQTAQPRTEVSTRERYGPVTRGETLWPIANRLKPQGVSTEQMMMALLRANPKAFRNGNVNNLKAGAVLRIPTLDEITSRTRQQARQAFREQTSAWRAQTAGQRTPPPDSRASEAPSARELAQPIEEKSELRILGKATDETAAATTEAPVDTTSDVEKQLLLTLENTEATRLEFTALRDQVRQMQEQMAQMRELLLLKERQIAALEAVKPAPVAPPVALELPNTRSAPQPAPIEPRPVAVAQPVRSPVDRAQDFLLQWWTLLAAAVLAMLGILLGLLLARRMEAGAASVSLTVRGDQPTAAARPYADDVARYSSAGGAAAAASAQPAKASSVPMEPVSLAEASPQPAGTASRPRVEPTGSTASRWSEPAGPDDSLELGDLDLGTAAGGVSDDEIESWVRDLEAEVEHEGADRDRGGDRFARRARAADTDLDVPLNVDPLEGLAGPDEDSELEAISVMQELLVDTESSQQDEPGSETLGRSEFDGEPEAVELKLELARAYIEIGDVDGARDILGEIVEDSMSGEQKEEAKTLLEALR